MTDITERLRRLYVQDGTNYVGEAADLIDNLRSKQARADQYHAAELADLAAERDGWKSLAEQRAGQMQALVNDVHSCGPTCVKAGCVNRRLRDALQGLLDDITEYQTINHLGGENNHWQVAARAALGDTK
jgi:hypothetical protein